MRFLNCFGSRPRASGTVAQPLRPVPRHHTRAHSAGPLTLNPVNVAQAGTGAVDSVSTLIVYAPSFKASAVPSLVVGDDEVDVDSAAAAHKKSTGPLGRVRTRVQQHFSQGSLHHPIPPRGSQES
ncbi:5c74947b-c997-4bd2-a70f-6e4cf598bd75 [Thermothielavioides terrestris]|uniref:5c74947b-c997-4bd2-a70f-6e4cf598bd75 n=1 Tax=Thermothielavioides terrestris TaxID=2587410 RepID=A0A446BDD9_9PEZI|nr:5c74947b-c997-4bd2-a70f-6e4cf598bd75 [Thermothielavioides terrestris]